MAAIRKYKDQHNFFSCSFPYQEVYAPPPLSLSGSFSYLPALCWPAFPRMDPEAAQLEKQHVHDVYESTAPYFSDLQNKAWPRVRQFLQDQKPGSLIADIGNAGFCFPMCSLMHTQLYLSFSFISQFHSNKKCNVMLAAC